MALADRRHELYSYRNPGTDENFIIRLFHVFQSHINKVGHYKDEARTLHGEPTTSARLARLVGTTEIELANMFVRTMNAELRPLRLKALIIFGILKSRGLNAVVAGAARDAAELTPSLAWVRSLRVDHQQQPGMAAEIGSEEDLYGSQLLCTLMWELSLNHMAYEPRHAVQALRDGMIPWLGEFTQSRHLDRKAGKSSSLWPLTYDFSVH